MGGKPTALMELLVRDYSRTGDTVLDTHMGAGTTGVACIRNGRKFIGIEIDLEAFEIACKRIEQAVAQGQLFAPEPVKQVQEALL
jgi:site-specific DNA-methyltransferase (adenine-specific)